ncbi:hypothetical protein SBA3_2210007 [Candidatus Sulfopaludibacter sp. SbA3]|nr:hypothetical protein SBA3_2210007 [Candidatus Sulfopaludibacter sp. SbA3]
MILQKAVQLVPRAKTEQALQLSPLVLLWKNGTAAFRSVAPGTRQNAQATAPCLSS